MAIQSRFGRVINFENEQRRKRYIEETKELARKHLAMQKKWSEFASSTGMPANFNAKLENGQILNSELAHEFGLVRLDYERAAQDYFERHEETLRAIGEGRLYQEERQLEAPLPMLARADTPEAKGFQELLKYELYGPTDTQRIEAATERMERLNRQAVNDLKELAVKYKELEQKWNAVTEEMGLDGIVSDEKQVFKEYVELKNEVEEATAAYWKMHGWCHEQDAQNGLAAEVFDSKVEFNKAIYPDIKTENGVVESEEVRKIFRAEIEAAAFEVEAEKFMPKSAMAQTAQVESVSDVLDEILSSTPLAEQKAEQVQAGTGGGYSAPRFTAMSDDAMNWARDNQFVAEHVEQHGGSHFHLVEARIRDANIEQTLERGAAGESTPRQAASNDDKATRELYERVEKQTELNLAQGKGQPDERSRNLGEKIQTSLRQQQAVQQQLADEQRRNRDQQHAMAA